MRTGSSWLWSLGALAALATASAPAQDRSEDAKGSWLLGVGAQVDEEANDSVLATLDVGVADSTWLSLTTGRSTSPADRADIEANTLVLGVDHRFAKVGFTLEAEKWGDSGVLETQDLAGSVYFDRESWRIGFRYEARDIDIPFTVTGPLGNTFQRSVNVDADRYSLDARVALAEHWQLYLGVAEYNYSRNLRVLPRIDALNMLSTSTLTLANSFIDHERSIGAEREIGQSLLNMRFATDRSAVDGSKLETFELSGLVPVGGRIDLEINLGRGRSDFIDAGLYGGLLLLIYSR